MRKWMLAAFVSCAVVAAQTKPTDIFEKAPPEVDNALRERVSKFFQAHVDGKFRLAEEVIAEDSKDFFYNMEKHAISASKSYVSTIATISRRPRS